MLLFQCHPIFVMLCADRHQEDIRALHFPSSASPEPKVSILHLNYSFLSMKSPALLMNAASLSTPCLHLLALSHGIR